MQNRILSFFKIHDRSSTIAQEVRAGVACFLTMSYILLVNAQVLALVGIPSTDVVIATSLSAGVGTMIAGIGGNLPFGLAPGIGLSAYLAYGLILESGLTTSQAFTSCFISGILLSMFSLLGISSFIMHYIPKAVKVSTIVGMGLQISLVGMTSVKLVVPNEHSLVSMGPLNNIHLWLALSGLILIGSLVYHNIKGAILIGVFVVALSAWTIDQSFPVSFIQFPVTQTKITDLINFHDFDLWKMTPAILAFLFIGIVDVSGVVFGMSSLAKLTDESGDVPGSIYAFLGCGIGTLVGAAAGSTPVIVYVETAAGIEEGGRTGLTAVVISMMFFASVFLAPLFSQIPAVATAPVSMFIGVMMMSQCKEIVWDDMTQAIPAFLTLIMMPFTFSITNGILFGLVSSLALYITTGKFYREYLSGDRVDMQKEQRIHKNKLGIDSVKLDHHQMDVLSSSSSTGTNANTYTTYQSVNTGFEVE